MKLAVAHDVSAEPEAVMHVIGPRWAARYVRNKTVTTYDAVLMFGDKGTVLSGQLQKALEKHSPAGAPCLAVGRTFTVEAIELARQWNCDLVASLEGFYTDEMMRGHHNYL